MLNLQPIAEQVKDVRTTRPCRKKCGKDVRSAAGSEGKRKPSSEHPTTARAAYAAGAADLSIPLYRGRARATVSGVSRPPVTSELGTYVADCGVNTISNIVVESLLQFTALAPVPLPDRDNIAEVLYMNYEQKMLPMEKRHIYDQFYTPSLYRAEFEAKPMVLFLGQVSFSFRGRNEYPGSMIGPEPTTDCFTVIYHSANTSTVMGTSLASDNTLPFQSLNMFGSAFLTRMRGATLPAKLLEHITFMDTPGILSGQKQRSSRGYDFASVVNYIAGKVDMIVLLFDTSKLDISDEYKQVIQCLKGNEEKIKIVLNKADQVGAAELIRVRGALMWSLSRILESPEVPKVFIGSFCTADSKDTISSEVHEIFTQEYIDFFDELKLLPSGCNVRKLNDVIKRAKKLKIHALIMEYLLRKMWCRTHGELKRVVTQRNLQRILDDFKYRLRVAESDLPDIPLFLEKAHLSYAKGWNKIDEDMMYNLDQFINDDIPRMVAAVQSKDKRSETPSVLEELYKNLMKRELPEETKSRKEVEFKAGDIDSNDEQPKSKGDQLYSKDKKSKFKTDRRDSSENSKCKAHKRNQNKNTSGKSRTKSRSQKEDRRA
uniref:Dynamin-type G domain-containing protein n=1 Tax=Setaria digitata TaxID=48799 RepID=A0A915Q809_9BILA